MSSSSYQDLARVAFEDLVKPSRCLLQDVTSFLQTHASRSVILVSARDVDALCSSFMLQEYLTSKLGLIISLFVTSSYTMAKSLILELNRIIYEPTVFIFLNNNSRQNLTNLFKRFINSLELQHLWCLIDYHRPWAKTYLDNVVPDPDSKIKMRIYLGEREYAESKLVAHDGKCAELFSEEKAEACALNQICGLLEMRETGEFFSSPSSLLLFEALSEYDSHNHANILAASIAIAFHFVNGSMSQAAYAEALGSLNIQLSDATKRWSMFRCNAENIKYCQQEINVPLLRQQPIKKSLETALLQIGSRTLNHRDVLNAMRTELELSSQDWQEVPHTLVIERMYDKLSSTVQRYLGAKDQIIPSFHLPMFLLDTPYGVFTNMDLAILLANKLYSEGALEDPDASGSLGETTERAMMLVKKCLSSNVTFINLLQVLHWLKRPVTLASTIQESLVDMVDLSKKVHEESIAMVYRLVTKRSCGVCGIKGRFEGFLEDNCNGLLIRSSFACRRVCFTIARILAKGILESAPQLVLVLCPPTPQQRCLVLGYVPEASILRTNKFGFGFSALFRARFGKNALGQDAFQASEVTLPGELAKRAFEVLFPQRKRNRSRIQRSRTTVDGVFDSSHALYIEQENKRRKGKKLDNEAAVIMPSSGEPSPCHSEPGVVKRATIPAGFIAESTERETID